MMFRVGQEIVCVDDSLAANPWHRANPLVKNQIYVVRALAGIGCIKIDDSRRAWQNWRFRPLVARKTDISALKALLVPGARVKADA